MKKFYAFLAAALINISAFASKNVVPSDAVLADYYDQGNVCVCIYVPSDIDCNDIVLTGAFNGWSSTVADCKRFEAVKDYDGWYVASFEPEAEPNAVQGILAKPIMLDGAGKFAWVHQVGAATVIRGGVTVVSSGNFDEIDLINYSVDEPNVFTVDGWKEDPCTPIFHNYTITVISDGCDGYAVPFVVGSFTNWNFTQMQLDEDQTIQYNIPVYTLSFIAAERSPYQIVSGLKDPQTGLIDPANEPGWYDDAYLQKNIDGVWGRIPGEEGNNLLTHEDTEILFDIRARDLCWARCNSDSDPQINGIDGIWYDFNDTNKTASVTYRGAYSSAYDGEYSGSVTIPSTVTYNGVTYSVTSIGDEAFSYCYGLTSVTIPNSVTSIGDNAFLDCYGLTSVTIPNSVTSIGDRAFFKCEGLTSVTIPNSVTSIGNYAFTYCTGLSSVIVESGNTKYDSRDNCNAIIETASNTLIVGFMTTTIPNSVTSIGDEAFEHCSGLKSIIIPNGVTSIGDRAFFECGGLTSVTIPSSVAIIGDYAFYGCSSLTSVTIPNSVTSIGNYAFAICEGLTSISVEIDNPAYDSRNNCNAIIETATNTLLFGCKNTIIPNGVTGIGDGAFLLCSGLTSLTIPNGVTSIGYQAFLRCSNLTSITFPNSVTSIGDWAFAGCINLSSIYNYASTPQIVDEYVFGGMYELEVNKSTCILFVPSESVDAYKTTAVWKEFENILPTSGLCGDNLYWSFANNTLSISGSGAMWDFPEEQPWSACYKATETFAVDLQEGMTYIGMGAFYSYRKLSSIAIPHSVTNIGDYAFMGCSLVDITLGIGIESIGAGAFRANSMRNDSGIVVPTIRSFTCLAINPPSVVYGEGMNDSFYGKMLSDAVVYVLANALPAYQAHPFWGTCNLQPIGAITADVTTIQVEPSANSVVIEWPSVAEADTYTIEIWQSNELVCTLTFNADGQLLTITYAARVRSRNVSNQRQALQTTTGWQYAITGLDPNTEYIYTVIAKKEDNTVLYNESVIFTTQQIDTSTEQIDAASEENTGRLVYRDGQILIQKGNKTYTLTGTEVK